MTKVLKATLSGSYKASNDDLVDFDGVKVTIPYTEEDLALMHLQGRYAAPAIRAAEDKDGEKKYPLRIDHMRQVFIDSLEEAEQKDEFSYVGKDIKEMSYDELQDLATAKDLRRIPLPKELSGSSLREMRQMAYMDYAAQVLGMDDTNKLPEEVEYHPPVEKRINPQVPGYNFAKLPPIIVESDQPRRDKREKVTTEDIIKIEQGAKKLNSTPKSQLTLDDLKEMMKSKSIPFQANISFDSAHAKLFGGEGS